MIAEAVSAGTSVWPSLLVNIPVAAAVIYTVRLFLEHIRGERKSRDEQQAQFVKVLQAHQDAVHQIALEVREQTVQLRHLAPGATNEPRGS